MIRRSGRSADELRNELLSDIERFREDEASRDRRWNMASRRVCEAIAVGRLEAWGIECQFGTRVPNKPRQSIPARDVDPDVSALIRAESGRPGIDFVDWLTVPRDVPVAKGEKPSNSWRPCRSGAPRPWPGSQRSGSLRREMPKAPLTRLVSSDRWLLRRKKWRAPAEQPRSTSRVRRAAQPA